MPVRTDQRDVGYDFFQNNHDENLELYPTSSASHPSEDIWKKFELIPTPPSSPQREDSDYWDDTEAKRHKLVTSLVDGPSNEDDFLSQSLVLGDFEFAGLSKNLQANVIKDCMWTCKEDTPCHPKDTKLASKFTIRTCRRDSESSSISTRDDSDCVDPLAVFPYSVSRDISSRDSLGTETPSDSEEEIDVVTVEKKILPPVKKRTHPSPEAIKQALAEHREMHNYTRPCPPSQSHMKVSQGRITINGVKRPYSSVSNSQSNKKLKRDNINISDLKSAVKRLHGGYNSNSSSRSSSRASSDSEDCERRSQHNVLERKRRNDLKSSFLGLRDMIPNLTQSERAPKVIILKKAAEYVSGLARTESRLKAELRSEESRKDQLLKRLQFLKRNSNSSWDY
ncbi:unnamed protein product [Owenia fusiformis]|uniref:Uncharacterized protein n=1 Tax=Owenia fusiformis TaxID=6347 RepID=A0A8J1Y048_OWEFU|nr:unnamed protein product [Owenia fusiformis]